MIGLMLQISIMWMFYVLQPAHSFVIPVWLLTFADHPSVNRPVLLMAILIGFLGLPLIAVSGISIVSKITRSEMQGRLMYC